MTRLYTNCSASTDSSTKEKEHEEKIVNGAPLPVESRKHEPVMLLMVGCQGSGKTKFAMDLVQYGAISWARINQDTLRGKAHKGLREECIVKARQLLDLGYCIVVDRMNFDHGKCRAINCNHHHLFQACCPMHLCA